MPPVNLMGEPSVTPPENNTTPANNGPEINYPEGWDESLKGHQSLLKFYDNEKKQFNFSNLAKSYVNAESLLGKDKIPVPHKDFTDDQWNEFYNKLGRPAREKYDVKNNVANNIQTDDAFFNKYLDAAHKNGLLPKQAQAIVDFYNNESAAVMAAQEEANKAAVMEGVNNLKKEWGNDYKNNIEKAREALFMFASDEDLKKMDDAGLLVNPDFTKMMYKIADSLKEDKFKTETKSQFGISRDELQAKIQEFYQPSHPYMQYNHPNKAYYQEQMLQMQRKLEKMN